MELWKPAGWGAIWQDETVNANGASDPFLMTGFDKKAVHFMNKGTEEVEFRIEVDVMGNDEWSTYKTIKVGPHGYSHHEFPDGYSAHWVRVKVDKESKVTVQFVYN